MALKEKVKFDILVDEDDLSTLLIRPVDKKLQAGSVYTINIKNIDFENNSTYENKEEFITEPDDYFYVTIEDVKELINGLKLPDESILRHIISASKTAVYWSKKHLQDKRVAPDFKDEKFKEDYYPFYMFIKLTAVVNSLKEFYIDAVSNPRKYKDVLSDLSREEEMDFNSIRKLIDDLDEEAKDWLELIVTITADPQWALRGKYSYSVYNSYSKPYHPFNWYSTSSNSSFNRGV